jgi:predicted peptidase
MRAEARGVTWRLLVQVTLSAMLVVVAAAPVVTAQAAAPRWEVRTYVMPETGDTLPYGVYLPEGYDPSRRYPLVVGLHGAGGDHLSVLRYAGMLDAADKLGAILVTPLGYDRVGGYGAFTALNACERPVDVPAFCSGPVIRGMVARRRTLPAERDALSERDVLHVTDRAMAELSVDSSRVVLWGHSMGGGGTYHIASRHPGRFKALAVVAPAPPPSREALQAIGDIPILVIHGDADDTVPVAGSRLTVAMMKQLGMRHEYVEVAGGDHGRIIARDPAMVERVLGFLLEQRP